MAQETTEKRVKEIIAEQLGLSKEEIGNEATFSRDLGVDVLDMIELVMAFEEEFDVEISDEEAQEFGCVQDVVNFISNRYQ